jgi:hypothetical protein
MFLAHRNFARNFGARVHAAKIRGRAWLTNAIEVTNPLLTCLSAPPTDDFEKLRTLQSFIVMIKLKKAMP